MYLCSPDMEKELEDTALSIFLDIFSEKADISNISFLSWVQSTTLYDNKLHSISVYEYTTIGEEESPLKLSVHFEWYKTNNRFLPEGIYVSSYYVDTGDACLELSQKNNDFFNPLHDKFIELTVLKEQKLLAESLKPSINQTIKKRI